MRTMLEAFAHALERKRTFVPIPAELLVLPSKVLDQIPYSIPMKSDQLIMLREDNTCNTEKSKTAFNIPRQTLEEGLQEIVQLQKTAVS